MINGRNIIISKGGSPIACVKTSKVQVEAEIYDLCPGSADEDWEHITAGKKSWGFSCTWLLSNALDLEKVLQVGYSYTIQIYKRDSQSYLYGGALCTRCEIDANVNSIAYGTFTFKGDGALKHSTPST